MPGAGLVAVGATVLLNMGQILVDRGEQQQGVDRIEAALRIRQAMAARSVAVASAQESLARVYLASGFVRRGRRAGACGRRHPS